MKQNASLMIQVGLSGGSAITSRSESNVGILFCLCGSVEVTVEVKTTKKIKIVHVVIASEKSDYEGLSLIHVCVGTSIQQHAPPAYMIRDSLPVCPTHRTFSHMF